MNRQELISTYHEFLEYYHLKPTDVLVGAGGALLVLGLRDTTNDIDASTGDDFYVKYKKLKDSKTTQIPTEIKSMSSEYVTNPRFPDVDMHLKNNGEEGFIYNSVFIYTPKYLLKFKKELNRPKDQEDIVKLEKYIASKHIK